MTQESTRAIVDVLRDQVTRLGGVVQVGTNLLPIAEAIEAALAIPAAQWTSKPPTEPGRYWTRTAEKQGWLVQVVHVDRFEDGRLCELDQRLGDEFTDAAPIDEWTNTEWWTVPLTEPPA